MVDSAGDRTIFNTRGIPGTGSSLTPLCNSLLPTGTNPTTGKTWASSGANATLYVVVH